MSGLLWLCRNPYPSIDLRGNVRWSTLVPHFSPEFSDSVSQGDAGRPCDLYRQNLVQCKWTLPTVVPSGSEKVDTSASPFDIAVDATSLAT